MTEVNKVAAKEYRAATPPLKAGENAKSTLYLHADGSVSTDTTGAVMQLVAEGDLITQDMVDRVKA